MVTLLLAVPLAAQGEPISVFVSIAPQRYFVERIAGELAEVSVLAPPGTDSHTFSPTSQQIQALGAADIWFTIGVELERQIVPRIAQAVPTLPIVDTSEEIRLRQMSAPGKHEEEHEEEYEEGHAHAGEDPHIWLGPAEVMRQATTVRDALVRLLPTARDRLAAGYDRLIDDIERLDEGLQELLAPIRGGSIYVAHPALGYLTDAYDLTQRSIETAGSAPSTAQIESLIEDARLDGVRAILTQPQFSQVAARTIAQAIGASVVPFDPMAEDWLANMRHIAEAIRASLP